MAICPKCGGVVGRSPALFEHKCTCPPPLTTAEKNKNVGLAAILAFIFLGVIPYIISKL